MVVGGGGLVTVTYPMCRFIVVLKGWDIEWAYDEIYSRCFILSKIPVAQNLELFFLWTRHVF